MGELEPDDLGRKIIIQAEMLGLITGVLTEISPHPVFVNFSIIGVDTRHRPIDVRNDTPVVVGW